MCSSSSPFYTRRSRRRTTQSDRPTGKSGDALSGPLPTVAGLPGLVPHQLAVEALLATLGPPAGPWPLPSCNDPATRADSLGDRPVGSRPVTKEVIMAEVGIELFPVSGETLEWRLWATFAAGVLNLADGVANGVIDRPAFKEAVDESVRELAKTIDVIPETVEAILYALGRVKNDPEPPTNGWRRPMWPET